MSDFRTQLQAGLAGTFILERELGGGGMSRVFLATETALDRRVVIKTVPADMLSATAAERFRREILTVARLSHPNIVPVLAAGDAGGVPWFSMPWVEGAALREQLARGPMPLSAAVSVLRDVARALADAHAHGVAHRDIKPENILLARGAAVVTDFGVAKALSVATSTGEPSERLTGTGMAIGTVAYMAPEQIAAEPDLDHRADLYAWGMVAYELLAGRPTFDGLSGSALIAAQIGTMPEPLAVVAPLVPPALAAIVMQCLAKLPADRPQRADELVVVLESLSGAFGAHAVSEAAKAPWPAVSPRRRSPWLFAAVGVAVLATAAAAVMSTRDGAASADERSIAVAPFRVAGAVPAVRYLREGLADLMVPQIQSVRGVRAPGMRVVMDRWRKAAGSVDDDLDDAQALRVAGAAGAGQLVMGEVVGSAERLTISARLLRVSDSKALATARVEGSADSLLSLAARITTALLALGDGASRDRLQSVLSSRPEALSSYLSGEREYRRGHYAGAGDAFAAAYRADTTFALAALRVTSTNGWVASGALEGDWLGRAWRHRERLTGADSVLLIAKANPTYPERLPLRQHMAMLEELAARANSAELWFHFGDQMLHYGGLAAQPNIQRRALAAFQRAEALDSTFAPALEHQTGLFLVLNDVAAARAAYARQARVDPDGDFLLMSRMMLAKVPGGGLPPVPADSIPDVSVPMAALMFGLPDAQFGNLPDVAFADSLRARMARAGTLPPFMEREMAWNSGRPTRAEAVSDDRASPLVTSEYVLGGLVWDGDTASGRRNREGLERWLREHPSDSLTRERATAWFYVGLSAVHRGDTAQVTRARKALLSLRLSPGPSSRRNFAVVSERLLAAHVAVLRGAPDARPRLERLDSLLIDAPGIENEARGTANTLLAGLWERIGQPQRALDASVRTDFGLGLGRLAATRVRRDARLLEQLGRPSEAMAQLRHYIALRAQAEPRLQSDVADAKATLARLERKLR